MSVDYIAADRIVELAFGKLDKPNSKMDFPKPGTLSKHFNVLLSGNNAMPTLSHQHSPMLATAGVEMWHRAIHSFLWSVALTKSSPLWASVSGYYASHFVMRALAHSMGIFKSFAQKKVIQISVEKGQFVCAPLKWSSSGTGEHAFYWKAVKGHPKFLTNDLFHENSERDPKSDSAHRTFANYTDHLCAFPPLEFPKVEELADSVEKISRIRLHSVTHPSRDDYPDLQNVQILAFQRILAFQDFLDDKVPKSRFWRAHRRPGWCNNVMLYQVEDQQLEQPIDI
ncbi:MAG: hypothetical protein Q7U97_15860 [Rhodocyclaceae bacterium]|nr:hypothetical protein [Rhodocyclaceae bacterium]